MTTYWYCLTFYYGKYWAGHGPPAPLGILDPALTYQHLANIKEI